MSQIDDGGGPHKQIAREVNAAIGRYGSLPETEKEIADVMIESNNDLLKQERAEWLNRMNFGERLRFEATRCTHRPDNAFEKAVGIVWGEITGLRVKFKELREPAPGPEARRTNLSSYRSTDVTMPLMRRCPKLSTKRRCTFATDLKEKRNY